MIKWLPKWLPNLINQIIIILISYTYIVIRWQTDKPGSVEDEHSSRRTVTSTLKQPTRVQCGQHHADTYLVLLRVEFTLPCTVTSHAVGSYPTLSPLPFDKSNGGLLSAALVVGLRLPAVSWHSALCSPDFPPLTFDGEQRSSGLPSGVL